MSEPIEIRLLGGPLHQETRDHDDHPNAFRVDVPIADNVSRIIYQYRGKFNGEEVYAFVGQESVIGHLIAEI